MGWDPGSEILDPEKTYSGSRTKGQKGTGSRIRIRNAVNSYALKKESFQRDGLIENQNCQIT